MTTTSQGALPLPRGAALRLEARCRPSTSTSSSPSTTRSAPRAERPPPARATSRDAFPFTCADHDRRQRQHRRHLAHRAPAGRRAARRARRAPRPRRAAAGRCARCGRPATRAVVAYMDVDLSTDLDALLPLVAPLLSGPLATSPSAPAWRRGARVVRGPEARGHLALLQPAPARRRCAARFSDAQCGFKAIRRRRRARGCCRWSRTPAGSSTPSCWCWPSAPGCASTRCRSTGSTTPTAASTSSRPRSTTCAASARLAARLRDRRAAGRTLRAQLGRRARSRAGVAGSRQAGAVRRRRRRSAPLAYLAAVRRCCAASLRRPGGEPRRAAGHRGRQHRRQPAAHLRGPRPRRAAAHQLRGPRRVRRRPRRSPSGALALLHALDRRARRAAAELAVLVAANARRDRRPLRAAARAGCSAPRGRTTSTRTERPHDRRRSDAPVEPPDAGAAAVPRARPRPLAALLAAADDDPRLGRAPRCSALLVRSPRCSTCGASAPPAGPTLLRRRGAGRARRAGRRCSSARSTPSNSITVDKPPASLWVMALSARHLRLQRVEHARAAGARGRRRGRRCCTRRSGAWFGPGRRPARRRGAGAHAGRGADVPLQQPRRAAGAAAGRRRAYAMTRALEHGRHALAGRSPASLVGFAFLTKMLQAFLVVPGVRAGLPVAGADRRCGARIGSCSRAGVAMVVGGRLVGRDRRSCGPRRSRPYIGGSQNNSVLELIVRLQRPRPAHRQRDRAASAAAAAGARRHVGARPG